MRLPTVTLLVAALFQAAVVATSEAGQQVGVPAEVQSLFEDFREAALQGDAAGIADLAHGDSRSCADREADSFTSRTLAAHLRIFGKTNVVIGLTYRPADDEALDRIGERDRTVYWPVRPEGSLQVEFDTGTASGANVANLMVGRDDGEWRWVHACRR